MKSKRVLAGLLAGAMAATMALTGCGAKGSDKKNEDTITVTLINNYYTAGVKKLADEYMDQHPNIKVVVDVVSDNDSYMTKMMTAMSGDRKNAPDIVHGNLLAAAASNNSLNEAVSKGYLYDMTEMLDEKNPYNDNKKVSEAFDEGDIKEATSDGGGATLGYLPFDKIGVAFYYNQEVFDKLGIEVPTTYEGLLDVCEKLQAKGYDKPVSAGYESQWLLNSLSDAVYRYEQQNFLYQPGDALWDENLMSDNVNFKFDDSNLLCDRFTFSSPERQTKYALENGINTKENQEVWSEFSKALKYFPDNWISADGTDIISDFESQRSPILFNGSWNAGLILNDINQLPEKKQFKWATFQINEFANAPEGFGKAIRGTTGFGNKISIVQSKDEKHMENVKDFYKFWYSPKNASTCYEETLANGNYVQGPPAIKGVELSKDVTEKLDGFKTPDEVKIFQWANGLDMVTQADKPKYNDVILDFSAGKMDVNEFLGKMDTFYKAYYQESLKKTGYDLDPATKDTVQQ